MKSDPIRVRTLVKPTNLTNNGVKSGNDDGFKVTWKKVTGATGYDIQCKVDGSNTWKRVHTVESGATTSAWIPLSKLGYKHWFRVRAVYENNGVTSYGEYSASSGGAWWYQNPSQMRVIMDDDVEKTSVTVIHVQNNGDYTVRFYSEGGRWLDSDNSYWNRDIVFYDYSQFYYNNRLVKTSYVDIAPGQSTYLLIGVKGEKTWYDRTATTIQMKARYNNQFFTMRFSYSKKTYEYIGYAG